MAEFKDRLELALKGQSVNGAAKKSGISQGLMRKYLSGSIPSVEKVQQMANALGVPFLWLATGEGEPEAVFQSSAASKNSGLTLALGSRERYPGEHAQIMAANEAARMAEPSRKGYSDNHPVNPALKGDLMQIPVMSAVASAGHGAVVLKEEVHEYMALSSAMVRTLKLSADETFIIYARGESMEPKIRGGEPLICSKAERHLKAGDGIYVVRLEGEILVKHVQRLPGGKVRIFSENTSYAPFEVTLNDGVDFAILGKVLHSIQQV